MIISIIQKKPIQHPFTIKAMERLKMKGIHLKTMKATYSKSVGNIKLSGGKNSNHE